MVQPENSTDKLVLNIFLDKLRQQAVHKKKNDLSPDIAKTYNEFKRFEGKQYTGMKVDRSHKWYYDKGEWK